MRREIKPTKKYGGVVSVPGDKSIAHRVALLSILSQGPITARNFPDGKDCAASVAAARSLGVGVEDVEGARVFTPPARIAAEADAVIDCGNSGTTVRLLSGIIAGSSIGVTLAGDASLSERPMDRIIEPLTQMGAEIFCESKRLPMKVVGAKLLPFEYRLPIPSAQVKSALLMAGLASSCSVTVREDVITRDHTERLMSAVGSGLSVREIKPVMVTDPIDPRKKRMEMPEAFKKEISISAQATVSGGEVDIPGDFSTAAFLMAGAAISKKQVTVEKVGLNPTRTGFLDYLKAVGCTVKISDREEISGEPRGTVTVTGGPLKGRKISGETTVSLLDEIPAVAIVAAFADGTTVIRDAAELKVKESNRLQSIAENLRLTGIKCGILEDGLVIEGGKELTGADFKTFGDHRIAMAFSVASLFLVGPSSIDEDSVVDVSCPRFYEILKSLTA